ncbi:glycine oxidase ThiO [Arenibaculum sp.]|uniref:glycine oxidase ThiO n=1 Tax=Arenibaculum sp. TaxID=2865862 RepID=UPI002E145866|nr:glycine oxidase ThiO [Arenibaculum sp.]
MTPSPLFPPPAPGARPRVAIVGAGVIGLGIAWRLAAAGCAVAVFDRGAAGAGASHAAAGMLAAGVETEPGEDALLRLNLLSRSLWPGFAAEVEAASGIGVQLRTEGTLVVALTADDVGRLRFNHRLQQDAGVETHWLTGGEVRRREPYLSPSVSAALYSPHDHQVENRLLAAALRRAAEAAGARVHEHAEVGRVLVEGGRARGVAVGAQAHAADVVVLAAGAWSRRIEGVPDEARPPVRPIKGQMLALRMHEGEPLLRHVVWTPGVYLVPRLDGRLLVGATVEERGFDTTITAGGMLALLEGAWRTLPGIEELAIEETWVGFRPGSRDDAPVLGPTPVEGLVLATGHHRNGILLTPVTVDAVSRLVLDGTVPDGIAGFGLDRFATGGTR